MNAGELIALAERCEAAAGPDRGLDHDIVDALNIEGYRADRTGCGGNLCGTMTRRAPDGDGVEWRPLPAYTASLDAAATLVPEGWFTRLAAEDRHSHSWRWDLRGGYGIEAGSRASTPALTLAAAALRARAALAEGGSNAA